MTKKFPFFKQLDTMDCGPTCLKMIAAYYGQNYTLEYLRSKSYFSRNGVSLKGIMEAAEVIGFRTMSIKVPFYSSDSSLPSFSDAPLPCIVHWNQKHFVVVYKYTYY